MAIKPATDLVTPFAHTLPTGEDDLDYALRTHVVHVRLPADAMPNTQTEHRLLFTDSDIVLQSVKILPEATTAADNTDYAVLNVASGDLAGGALATPIASPDTRAASLNGLASNVAKTLFSGSSAVPASRRLSLNVTKAGAGKTVGACTIQVVYKVA
jgi:hypothetical protein